MTVSVRPTYVSHLTTAEIDHAEATFNNVAAITSIARELESQFKLLDDFLNPSNLVLTVQLISNQAIRGDTVVAVHLNRT